MLCLHKLCLNYSRLGGLLGLALLPATARAQSATAQFRFLSTVIRDHLPSSAEARAFAATSESNAELSSLVQEWMKSTDFQQRLARFFNDQFGSTPYIFLSESDFDLTPYNASSPSGAPPDLSTPGVYYLPTTIKATCGTPVSVSAWWSDSRVQVCSSAVTSAISFAGGINCSNDGDPVNGWRNAACGCGPEEILCYPADLKSNVMAAVTREFPNRALYAYQQGWGWDQLLGGDTFYGSRWLYHHYLYQEEILVTSQPPNASEMALLTSLPLTSMQEATLITNGPERGGVVTEPAFLRRFNSFRSRIRALSNLLLCKDIDGSLNTDSIATFVNPDLSAFDQSHGKLAGCSTCHFGLDNQGSILLSWDTNGFYQAWAPTSTLGHVFGETGSGPRFLMQSYVERGTDFTQCMARTVWEGFSGDVWTDLSASSQANFTAKAALGPEPLIQAVLSSQELLNLRAPGATPQTATTNYNFATDINPILEASCSGVACHSANNNRSPSSGYVGNEALFKAASPALIANGAMPPAGSAVPLTAAQRTILLDYLAQ